MPINLIFKLYLNKSKQLMSQFNQTPTAISSRNGSSLVQKTNKYTYMLFKPFSKLPWLPKK